MSQITEYDPVEGSLAELRRQLGGVQFDVATVKGLGEAKAARFGCVKLRTGLEELRVALKAPALERTRQIDAEAKRIREAIEAVEKPVDEQIKAIEAQKEAERQAKIRAEVDRLAAIRRQIAGNWGTELARGAVGKSSATLLGLRVVVEAEPVDDSYAELKLEAQQAKVDSLEYLDEMIEATEEREKALAAIALQRAELAEQAKKDAAARAEQKKIDDAARQGREDEEAVARAERGAVEAEQRRMHDEQQAEQKRQIEDARAALAERERVLDEERAAAERARQEAADQRQRDEEAAKTRSAVMLKRLHAQAPAMLDCLRAWKTGEEMTDVSKIVGSKVMRDEILKRIGDLPGAQPQPERPRP